MLFNSWIFVLFLIVVLAIYYLLPYRRQNVLLLVASYVFYGYWDWRFCSLLAMSTLVDYFVARAMDQSDDDRRRKRLLLISIFVNLGALGFFKYFNFFIDSALDLVRTFGIEPNVPLLSILLPVGISFYTFQTMAYTIDVYRRQQPAIKDFVPYAVYVCYFPQLVAGPIERAQRLLPQFQNQRTVSQAMIHSGAQLILWGYFKKVAVADSLAPHVDAAFTNPGELGTLQLWLGVYAFALQIYCDFSGYSDIARGVSRLFGIELIENFRQPYLSRNITEFWRRWHISLSSWLRDYLYIPLGGNRRGARMQYRNLFLTMLIGGLWHGAAWTFVLWGGLHGAYLAIHKFFTKNRRIDEEGAPTSFAQWLKYVLGVLITFHLVCIAWVAFRAPDFSTAMDYLRGLAFLTEHSTVFSDLVNTGIVDALVFYGSLTLILDALCWYKQNELPFTEKTAWWIRSIAYFVGLFVLCFVREGGTESFIYFQF